MVKTFCCPKCGKTLRVPVGTLSPTIRCEHCRRQVAPQLTTEQAAKLEETAHEALEATISLPADAAGGGGASADPSHPAGQADQRLGRFEIRGQLGSGSFGTVYRAYDPLLEREVALKVPHTSIVQTGQGRERMLREAKTAARLHHAHIVPLYDAGQDGGHYYIASAFIPGQTLQQQTERERPDFRHAATLVMELASALDYAHRQGIIHRDVKPGNIMLDDEGEPLLMDFGLARFEQSPEKLTQEGTVMGTPAYMAPEQASGRTDLVGPAADQYSLGVVLYELLCGKVPFEGPIATVIANVVTREPERPRSLDRRIPRDLETICLKAMAKQPQRRFADCRRLADDLRRWLDDQPIHARRLGPVERFWRWCGRNPGLAAAVSSVAVLLVVLAIVLGGSLYFISLALDRAEESRKAAEIALERAEDEGNKALAAQARAEQEEQQAKQALESEKRALESEKTQRRRAEAEELRAETARGRAETSLYFSRITLAHQKWMAGDVRHAERLLDSYRTDAAGLRNWEWGCLKRMCHSDRLTLTGHEGAVYDLALSPDGHWIASAGEDHSVRIWEAESGRESQTLIGHTAAVRSVAFRADSARLVSAGDDLTIRVWDLAGGRTVQVLRGEDVRAFHPVRSVAFSADGLRIISSYSDSVRVWDAQSGAALFTLGAHALPVWSIAAGPDGRWIVSGSEDRKVKVWDIQSREERFSLDGHTGPVRAVAVSPDGLVIASAGEDTTVIVWDAETGRQRLTLRGHTGFVNHLAFSPDGKQIAAAGEDTTVRLWDVATGNPIRIIRGHTSPATGVAFSPDGQSIVTSAADATVKVWDRRTGTSGERILTGHEGTVQSVAFSPDSRLIASAGEDRHWKIWDAADGRLVSDVDSHDKIQCVAFDPLGRRIATAGDGRMIDLWDVASGEKRHSLVGHRESIWSIAFSADGRWIVSGSERGRLKLWDLAGRKELRSLDGHHGAIWNVAVGPHGRRIASAGADGLVKVWDPTTGEQLLSLESGAQAATCVAFDPGGRRLATADYSADYTGTIRFWDLSTGIQVFTLPGHANVITSLVFSPDGRRLISAGYGGTIKLWAVAQGQGLQQEVITLQGHTGSVRSAAISPDGRRIATGGEDRTVRIWETITPADAE